MLLDPKTCYTALMARNPRFDGHFFFGVSSTGIYCRPVCRARTPKAENCSYYASAAAAEASGFRPCLRCRPELAPGSAPVDSEAGFGSARRMNDSNSKSRVKSRRRGLRRRRHTTRMLRSRRRANEDSALIWNWYDIFRKHYGYSPTDFRKTSGNGHDPAEPITLLLAYRPPFAWKTLLKFLAERAIPGVELVDALHYKRTVVISHKGNIYRGWLAVSNIQDRNALAATLSPSLFPVLNQVLSRIRFLFDLNCTPDEIREKLGSMQIGEKQLYEPGLRLPGCFDPFEMAVRAILGQQITVRAARTIAMRIASRFGESLTTPFPELDTTFPGPEQICALEQPVENHLGPLGVTGARARSIRALAEALQQRTIRLGAGADPEREMTNLAALPGFGPWTVQYLAMRIFGWPDAFPHTDYGVKKALGNRPPREMLALAQQWAPWRSYATLSLWNSLN